MKMSEAKAIYNSTGKYFFDKETVKFWGAKIETELYKNHCFVTSERNFDNTKRLYSVRQFSEDFTCIDTVGEFQAYTTKETALEALKEITR